MITVKEVTSAKERRIFLNFPIKLYKGNEFFVPPLYIDEKKIFRKDYVYNDMCDVIFLLAFKDNLPVGRISGIIQVAANEKWGQKRVRFTRFDAIDDQAVANALFDAVVRWAKDKGMTELVGPLGYSDLEREGLLIEGFDQLSTFEEQYNFPYYQKLIENYGFVKEVDWLEHKLYLPKERDEKLHRVSAMLMEKYGLTLIRAKSIKEYLKQYRQQFFEILDKTYVNIYGSVPFTDKMAEIMVENFKLIATPDNVATIVDKDGKVVGFALSFPSIAEIVNKSKGRLTIPFILRFLRVKKHPKIIDLGLIGVLPEYESKGIATVMIAALQETLAGKNIEHLETNLVLEDNFHSLNLQKRFKRVMHKKRRCFVKQI
ncbi:MAG: GNAT family N-acetyltransferase [Clostridia bacterium]|nr:GNAT family N-acetyltransferase [Clostridia bacterium]